MKKVFFVLLIGLFLAGCSSGIDYGEAKSSWKNWDHIKFSAVGYKNPSAEDHKKSMEQGWWGEPIPYIPAE
ncbi:MAG: membrane lipoprotein lipid attachment site-containing protein [Desulfobacterales bacterium]|nr:membrane lipoprotein lipid attachment site-containing protein [Desulfobacterales bacterium]MDJ0912317.1 membrane lipoprotein lipid attachment site-containing protein [Desulfobacterales bacterium]